MDKMIELAGKNYALRYTVNSMCAVEARAGGPLDCLLKRDFSAARLLLWGGLIDGCPELTLREAGELAGDFLKRGGALDELVGFCADAMRDAGFFRQAEEPADSSATPGRP